MKTNELTGAALDWAVATCEGGTGLWYDTVATYWVTLDGKDRALSKGWAQSYTPSTNWAQGGPIIERAGMEFSSEWCDDSGRYIRCGPEDIYLAKCQIEDAIAPTCAWGPTHLIAAMRCYVAANLGAEVDVPKELTC